MESQLKHSGNGKGKGLLRLLGENLQMRGEGFPQRALDEIIERGGLSRVMKHHLSLLNLEP
ncbi:MAG: hypothetical protein QXN53_08730 [Thermoproteota archaeon]